MPELALTLCTAPNVDVARAIARALVDEGLAACVNLVPGVTSVYRWDGATREDGEVLLLVKTAADRRAELAARLVALHPYEVPEVVSFTADHVAPSYLDWLVRATR